MVTPSVMQSWTVGSLAELALAMGLTLHSPTPAISLEDSCPHTEHVPHLAHDSVRLANEEEHLGEQSSHLGCVRNEDTGHDPV